MDLTKLLLLACNASLRAGSEIMKVYSTDFNVDRKDDNSPLTLADQNAHDSILENLSETEYPVLSEEGVESDYRVRKEWKRYWCVDPLDGTREFVKRNGEFTVNIALMENNSPLLGVIYIPVQDLLYAADGKTIYRINEASVHSLKPSFRLDDYRMSPHAERKSGDALKVLISRSHLSLETKQYLAELEKNYDKLEFLSAGSALKFGLLAEGNADLYPRFSPCMEWDTAAGHALLKTVGKNIYSYPSGTELTYNKINLVNDWFIAR